MYLAEKVIMEKAINSLRLKSLCILFSYNISAFSSNFA